jgi:hypothetical protein
MSDEPEVIDADVVGAELEPVTHGNLFRTEDPVEIIRRASDTAQALADVLRKQKLTVNIQGREHVRVEGWTLLGTMLGVFPVCEWTRQVTDGWEARVEARTLAGQVVGAAEAECLRTERTWSSRDDYALRSMAQTRATSKALRQPLGFVVSLAGFDPTPAEEMPRGTPETTEPQARIEGPPPLKPPTSWAKLTELVSSWDEPTYELFQQFVRSLARLEFGKEPAEVKAKADKDWLFQKCAGAAVHLREAFDPNVLPFPVADDVRAAFAQVLDGQELAIENES